jgi:hypothetical protein
MPMNLPVNASPCPPTSPRAPPSPHPHSHATNHRTRSAFKRHLTNLLRERTGDPRIPTDIGTTEDSSPPRPPRRSVSVSALRPSESHRGRTISNGSTPVTQYSLPEELPPSYTILAPPPREQLLATHSSPTHSARDISSHAHAQPRDGLYVPPRSSSVVCRHLRTEPPPDHLDESSRRLIHSLCNEQARMLESEHPSPERLVQEQIDADMAYALHMQELLEKEEQELAMQQPLWHIQSAAASTTDSASPAMVSQIQCSLSTTTTTTQGSKSQTSSPTPWDDSRTTTPSQSSASPLATQDSLTRNCVICKGWKTPGAFPKHKPTELCDHDNSTCSRCLKHWVRSKLRFRGARGVDCAQCRVMLNAQEINRASL